MIPTKIIVEVRRGMIERVYSDVPDIQVFVFDQDGERQGYGDASLEIVDVHPVSAFHSSKRKIRC